MRLGSGIIDVTNLLPALVYFLCFATSTACAVLLGRSFMRQKNGLLFWSAGCFALLAANNFFVIVDLTLVPSMDLRMVRLLLSLAGMTVLLFGFIWNADKR
jgi:hypothetical protein